MTQIKIFEGHGNNELEINQWLAANKNVRVISVNMVTMHDLYCSGAP